MQQKKTEKVDTLLATTGALASSQAGLTKAKVRRLNVTGPDGMNPRDFVSSLARGLEVLRTFNRTGRKMTLSQVASETGITRAGARRILLSLIHI